MQGKLLLRVVSGLLCFGILLVPGAVFSYSWGASLNLEVAFLANLVVIIVAFVFPKARWHVALPAAFVIAVPPYPFWTDWSEERGQYFHFFHGFTFSEVPILTFLLLFFLALLFYAGIFLAIRGKAKETGRVIKS